ncbi:MAG TPA: thiol:disulfide interchange protein DsbA/DsbL [Burkholderiaceae bacterium]|nr:thiol:disulfide interchange protein DsbA/DsbL [Burkholderiaceae bacterium]
MKRREFSLSTATALAASTVGLSATPAAWAQAKKPQEGSDYIALDKRVAVEAAPGKVEVIEFFWYSCPHCNAFEPKLETWIKNLPKEIAFRRVPVAFNNSFVPQQKLYYALEALGKVEAMQRKVFYAIHVEKQQLARDEAIFEWVAKQGLDKEKFQIAYNFTAPKKAQKATELQDAYKVSGVPALGIAGRYYTDGSLAQSMERALQVTEYLVAETRKTK